MLRSKQIAGLLAVAVTTIGIFSFAAAQQPASPAEKKIRQAFEGEFNETGDGILDDVIGIIQQRGSILDGSSLDPTASETRPNSGGGAEKAYAAEQLLRASRLLERVGPAGKDRADLVNKMRAEAVKLLSE